MNREEASAPAAARTPDGTPDGTSVVWPTPDGDPATALARRCAEVMWAADEASRGLGMRLLDVTPGRSRLAMRVTAQMVNGHATCHGGFLSVLADSAFAFACNAYDDVTVAAGFDIVFVAPARLGEDLEAVAVERARYGRSGLYDVTVTRADGTLVAEYRGRSRSTGRAMLPGTDTAAPAAEAPAGHEETVRA